MSDKESEQTYNRKGSRVYGNGMSINCTNIVTAENLQNTLNNYETEITHLQSQIHINTNYEKLQQYIIALQMDIKTVQGDIDKIKDLLK